MIEILPKIVSYRSYKKFGYPKVMPIVLTLSVTDMCNSRCKTCNIWKVYKANPKKVSKELTLDEYKEIFKNFKKLFWVTITGGEPFLRKDLKEIIISLYNTAKPDFLTIATNGTMGEKIVKDIRHILKKCPETTIFINLSLDGIDKLHDSIRGMNSNCKKVMNTLKVLKKIKSKKLFIGINTVISKYNVNHIEELYEFVRRKIRPDSHIFELAENRSKLYNLKLKLSPRKKDYKKVIGFIISKLKEENKEGKLDLIKSLRIEYYNSLLIGKFPKGLEGIASAYIMNDGGVWVSYSKKYIIGNLRNSKYDFNKIWFSEKGKKIRKIMEKNYNTTLVNAFYINILFNFTRFSHLILKIFLKYLKPRMTT